MDNPSPELEAEIAAAITEEQLARFKRIVCLNLLCRCDQVTVAD